MSGRQWSVVGSSVIGASHLARGATCQDAHCWRTTPVGLVAVVADGAGSAPRSDEGAWVAVHRAAAVLERAAMAQGSGPASEVSDPTRRATDERVPAPGTIPSGTAGGPDWEERMATALAEARAALENLALQEASALRAFHCTLSCALALEDRLVVGQIGDGAIVARGRSGSLFTAAGPQRGEYANEAYFLTMDGALDLAQVSSTFEPVDQLALTTDGLIRLALDLEDNRPHVPFFDPLLEGLRDAEDTARFQSRLASFLASDRVAARSDDDKTLILAVRQGRACADTDGGTPTESTA